MFKKISILGGGHGLRFGAEQHRPNAGTQEDRYPADERRLRQGNVYALPRSRWQGPRSGRQRYESCPNRFDATCQDARREIPANSVASVLRFGNGPGAHGSAEMPLGGPLFQSLDKFHDTTLQQRISNIVTSSKLCKRSRCLSRDLPGRELVLLPLTFCGFQPPTPNPAKQKLGGAV